MHFQNSLDIMQKSRSVFPGGVNSPVRSFYAVGGHPIVFSHGRGKHVFDVDGNCFIDFCSSWGPLILGYSNENVVAAIQKQAEKAVTFGAPSILELELAEKMRSWVPGLEMLRFVNSGTEATMSAVRVARGATGRSKFIKFEGCYHGHADSFLVKAGSGLATLGNTSSAGVTAGCTQDTLSTIFNSIESVEEAFTKFGADIACLIVEPLAANMGLVKPKAGFLKFLRDICNKYGALLIFDEVMTGFRLAKGGATELYGVQPDLMTFGKIVGGGLPAAAYGGRSDLMHHVAPLGKTYQAGTLSGNPLAMAAGLATLNEMERVGVFDKLSALGKSLDLLVHKELKDPIQANKLCYVREESFFFLFFGTALPPQNFSDVTKTDMKLFNRIYHEWLNNSIYLGPSGYEVGFLNVCHDHSDLEKMVQVIKNAL
ncbi:MAG: glutamate-1-semialdehyde 2,1-aminomutase [Silvanigrellaceae bacterium]|nr:glutamate-1-semialdehyde 2,1-aminomutase [Silvanigrellaceae bacterium]